jgi:hypothetical protein
METWSPRDPINPATALTAPKGNELLARIAFDLFADGSYHQIGDIRFAIFELGQAGGFIQHHLLDQALDAGHFAPAVLKGLQDHLDAGPMAHEFVGIGADGMSGIPLITDLFGRTCYPPLTERRPRNLP